MRRNFKHSHRQAQQFSIFIQREEKSFSRNTQATSSFSSSAIQCCNAFLLCVSFQFSIPLISLRLQQRQQQRTESTFTLTRIKRSEKNARVNGNRKRYMRANVLCSICLFDKDLNTQHTLWINKANTQQREILIKQNLHLSAISFCHFFRSLIYASFNVLHEKMLKIVDFFLLLPPPCLHLSHERFYRT